MILLAFLFLLASLPAGSARLRHPPKASSECHPPGDSFWGGQGQGGALGGEEEGLEQADLETEAGQSQKDKRGSIS